MDTGGGVPGFGNGWPAFAAAATWVLTLFATAVQAMVPSSASPIAPPTCWAVLRRLEATPESCSASRIEVSHAVDSRRAGLIARQKVPGLRDRRQGVRRRYQGRPVTVAPAAPGLIDRGDLVAALDRAAAGKVTVISAPAGSGKTSLLRAWAGRPGPPHRLALVQVQRDQRDAQQFWLALLDAVRHATGANSGAEPPTATPEFNAPAMAGRVLSELADA